MLKGRDNAVVGDGIAPPLKTSHACHTQFGCQVRVFTKGFLNTSPTRVARNIQHRRKRLLRSYRTHFQRGNGKYLLDGVGVPSARQPNSLGKAGSVTAGVPV